MKSTDVIWIDTIGMKRCPTFTTSDGTLYKDVLHPVMIREKIEYGVITLIKLDDPIPDIIKDLQAIEHKSIIDRTYYSRSNILAFHHGHYENEQMLNYDYCKEICKERKVYQWVS